MSDQETMFVTVRMPADMVKQIDKLAMEAMRSRSAQVIMMLTMMLKQSLERGAPNV